MRAAILLLLLAVVAPAPEVRQEFVQAVEFPYYSYPPQLWERELVWLQNLGIDTVAFSIPWNWHQVDAETTDFTGNTSPRRDLIGLMRLLKRAGLRAWIRPAPPVKAWMNSGYPAGMESDRRALRKWLWDLSAVLDPFLASHGGPIAFVEGSGGVFNAPQPPLPISRLSAKDAPRGLIKSREMLATGHGTLLWDDVEDLLPPPGWEAAGTGIFQAGAVSLSGDERTTLMPLRRDASINRYWSAAMAGVKPSGPVRTAAGRLPPGVLGQQLIGTRGASAVGVINESSKEFAGALRVFYPPSRRRILLPMIRLAPGEALCLPVNIPLAEAFCRDCSGFANGDHIVYATAELNATEYENGILAMEFSAPREGEVLLQLSRAPSGPFLAAGRPRDFDWDGRTQRARLIVPAGQGPASRVRIGLAIQPPDTSAFFVDAKRLTIGQTNRLETSYSSEGVAQRSRLLLPQSFRAVSTVKSPTEIEYAIDVPGDALHGEWAPLALEADGVLMSRARLQMLRPISVRVRENITRHYGTTAELPIAPGLVAVDANAGREVS